MTIIPDDIQYVGARSDISPNRLARMIELRFPAGEAARNADFCALLVGAVIQTELAALPGSRVVCYATAADRFLRCVELSQRF